MNFDIITRQKKVRSQQDRLRHESAIALQVESSLIEMEKEVEIREFAAHSLNQMVEGKTTQLDELSAELLSSLTRYKEFVQVKNDELNQEQETLDVSWKRLTEEEHAHEQQHQALGVRLSQMLRELEEREANLRDRLRLLSESEQVLSGKQRVLLFHEQTFLSLGRSSIERQISELRERESLLHKSLNS